MKIDVVKSGAPRPLANYSEAMVAGPWIFAAGQLASDFNFRPPLKAATRGAHSAADPLLRNPHDV
jgi:enamine deaminase RidA (YjgF/YER057c/UK114 family)